MSPAHTISVNNSHKTHGPQCSVHVENRCLSVQIAGLVSLALWRSQHVWVQVSKVLWLCWVFGFLHIVLSCCGQMSYSVFLSQWITLHTAFTQAFTQKRSHTHIDKWIHCFLLAMFGESKPGSKRVHSTHNTPEQQTLQTKLHRFAYYFDISSWSKPPLQSNFLDPIQPVRIVLFLCQMCLVFKEIYGVGMAAQLIVTCNINKKDIKYSCI